MSIRTLALAAALMAGFATLTAGGASAQAVNPNVSANAGIGGQPGLAVKPRICGVNRKCETPPARKPPSGQPPLRIPRR